MADSSQAQIEADSGLYCLAMLARFHGIAADPAQLRHRFAPQDQPFGRREILLAARHLGLKARALRSQWPRLAATSLPAIAIDRQGGFFILARIQDATALVQSPASGRAEEISRDEFAQRWSGELILMTRRAGLFGNPGGFNIRWFLPALYKYRRLFAEVLLASLFLQLFALVTPLFFQVIIDKVLVHKGLTTLDVLAIGLLLVTVFEILLGGLRTYVFSHTTNRIDVTLGAKLYHHVLALPLAYFEARRVGDTVARVRELDTIRNFLTSSALTVVVDLLFTVVFLAVMYAYSPVLFAVVLGAIPAYVLLAFFITPALRARLNDKFNRGADNQAFLVESVSNVETLKSMAIEPQMQRRWEEQLAGYVQSAFRTTVLGTIANQGASLINKITVVLILWLGARLVIDGDLSVGQLVAFNMLAARVSQPVLRLAQLWQDFQQAGISLRRLGDILNTPTEPSHPQGRTALPELRGHIRFEHLRFRYQPDTHDVLSDIDLTIPAGQVVGIVGRSGSGKSTLAKLVQRMYAPVAGRVLIDGADLSLIEPAWLRRQISVVMQENRLFNRSIRDNIALAAPGLPMPEVIRAAQLAGAHDFILATPQGYDTLVVEQGANLSGGQRQRIAIARALVTRPKILILDEATSALDYESERCIQDNMRRITSGRTVLIIAHRLSAVRQADRILVLDNGRIIEDGPHRELIERGGLYAHLYTSQSADVSGGDIPQNAIAQGEA